MDQDRNKFSIKLGILLIGGLSLLIVLYLMYGHQLIAAMYERRAIGFLNKIIRGQHLYPVSYYYDQADKLFLSICLSFPFLLVMLIFVLRPKSVIAVPYFEKYFERHTDAIDEIKESQLSFWIFLAAGLTLFMELLIIRLHSSYFQLFAYFKNVSLLSCFLGLGIGYARGFSRPLTTPLVLPLFVVQIICMYILRFSPLSTSLLQNPISEYLTFGLQQGTILHIVVVYFFIALIFAFNALCFIPLGHLTSRLMSRQPKLVAYSWNLLGSLAGICLFSLLSFMWLPPYI